MRSLLLCAAAAATAAAVAPRAGRSSAAATIFASRPSGGRCMLSPTQQPDSIAQGIFLDTVYSNGWGQLWVKDMPASAAAQGASPDEIAFAAGCVEAALTQPYIYAYWYNYKENEYGAAGPSADLVSFMTSQLAFVRANTGHANASGEQVWQGMTRLMSQFDGLVAGYQASAPANETLSELDIYFLNSVGDLEDLNNVYPNTGADGQPILGQTARARAALSHAREPGYEPIPTADKLTDCSSLVRVLPGNADILVGQTTWRSYYAMLRIYKVYSLQHLPATAGSLSFSSSPGFLHSKDDFYASPAYASLETTNSIYNTSLYKLLTPESLFSWQRVFVANGWATSGRHWTELMSAYNSGTYNNGWQVLWLASGLFTPGAALPSSDLLWLVEQIPGSMVAGDITPQLASQGYWASYNIPYFPSIFNASGYPAMVEKYGPSYSWGSCQRAQIFARNASMVLDMGSMQALMRYNNFQTDPLAGGDPILGSVSSRGDLIPAASPSPAPAAAGSARGLRAGAGASSRSAAGVARSGPVPFGGVDSKIVSAVAQLSSPSDFNVYAECGPTHDQQKVFSWGDFPQWASVPHFRVPDSFPFAFVQVPAAAPAALVAAE